MTLSGNRQASRPLIHAMLIALPMHALVATSADAQERIALPQITVHPNAPKTDMQKGGAGEGGAHTNSGNDASLDALNRRLKRKVDEVNPIGNDPPLDARSPDTKTGVVNIPGVQQQYGKNFGNSVVPFRPSPPVFGAPFGVRR